jgi:hypothetical protein
MGGAVGKDVGTDAGGVALLQAEGGLGGEAVGGAAQEAGEGGAHVGIAGTAGGCVAKGVGLQIHGAEESLALGEVLETCYAF